METNGTRKNSKKIIPLVLCSDNNYAPLTHIAIFSILKNASHNTFLDFHLLVPQDFDKKYRDEILRLSTQANCKINFIDMGTRFSDVTKGKSDVSEGRFPPAAYYRLLIAELLPNHDKCIYLDVDLIVRHDLTELYDVDIENYYLAAVKDGPLLSRFHQYLLSIGIQNSTNYVNSGVLSMNLELIRKDNLTEQFISRAGHGIDGKNCFRFADQDILNVTCSGKIKFMDLKFNAMSKCLLMAENSIDYRAELELIYGAEQFNEAANDPCIAHFAGDSKFRPWELGFAIKTKFSEEWREYARMSPFYEEMLHKNYRVCKIASGVTFGEAQTRYRERCAQIEKELELCKNHG